MEKLHAVSSLTESSRVGAEAIAEIRERLANISGMPPTNLDLSPGNAAFFANAPSDMHTLLAAYDAAIRDLDPLEFWCDLAEALGHERPAKADVPALVSEVASLWKQLTTAQALAGPDAAQFVATVIEQRESLRERLTDNEQMLQRQIESFNLEWAKKREAEQECKRLREQLVESERQRCPATLMHPLAQSLVGRILTADAPLCDPAFPHDVDLRLHLIITERDQLRARLAEVAEQLAEADNRILELKLNVDMAHGAALNDAIERMKPLIDCELVPKLVPEATTGYHLAAREILDLLEALRDEQPKGGEWW